MAKVTTEKRLQELLDNASCPPLVLISGPDRLRKERAWKSLAGKFVPNFKKNPSSAIQKLDGKELNQERLDFLAGEINSLSLFSAFKAFLIERADKIAAAPARKLAALLEQIPPETTFFFLSEKTSDSGPVFELCRKNGVVLAFPELKGAELKNWIKLELTRAKIKKCAASVIDLLISSTEGSPDQIAQMIEQLALYVDGGNLLESDFFALFVESVDSKDYELLDAIAAKNISKAEVLLDNILKSGRSPMLVLSSLYRTYSNYLVILNMLKQGRSNQQICDQLNLKPWLLQKLMTSAKTLTIAKARSKLNLILAADGRLKSRSLGAEAICSDLICRLAA